MFNNDLCFKEGGIELLDDIQPLWEQLIVQHQHLSTYFPEHFAAMTFDKRCVSLLERIEAGAVLIGLVLKASDSTPVAYAISSCSNHKVGELESIFVDPAYRGKQIGSQLVKRALEWMDGLGAVSIVVSVANGNEQVIDFYSNFGFFPRSIILQYKA